MNKTDIKKKFFFGLVVLLLFCFLIVGCGPKSIRISTIAVDYLKSLSVSKSKILSCDYSAILEVKPQIKRIEVDNLRAATKESLIFDYYNLQEKESEAIQENDWIQTRITLRGDNKTIKQDYVFYIAASENGRCFPLWQKELLGKHAGFSSNISLSEHDLIDEGEVFYQVEKVFSGIIRNENRKIELESIGIHSLSEFYSEIMHVNYDDHYKENLFTSRQYYIDDCLSCCQFDILEEEIEQYAKELLKEYHQEAEFMGTRLEAYWDYKQNNSIGVEIKSNPYAHAAAMAEREIKKALFIGAMANYLGISFTDDEAKDYYYLTGRNLSENALIRTRFEYLEKQVISACSQEMGDSYFQGVPV